MISVIYLLASEIKLMLKRGSGFVGLAVAACFVGCASTPPPPPEDVVQVRAQAWLDAVVASDIEAMYGFTSPAYQSAHSLGFYAKGYAGRSMWRAARLGSISCDDVEPVSLCKVQIVVSFRGFTMREELETSFMETWVQIDDVWYTKPD